MEGKRHNKMILRSVFFCVREPFVNSENSYSMVVSDFSCAVRLMNTIDGVVVWQGKDKSIDEIIRCTSFTIHKVEFRT